MSGTVITEEPGRDVSMDEGDGFDQFYATEQAAQVRRATLLVGDREAAHDIVQEALVDVLRRWGDLGSPGGYLSVAVLNRCRDHARRRRTAERRLPVLLPPAPPEDEILWDALQALPFNHRAAVVLRYYLQMPTAEIAEHLGCRPGSVGPWIQRGLVSLRKAMA